MKKMIMTRRMIGMKTNNIILGVTCATLTGVVAFIAVKLLKKKTYIDITKACSEMNEYFDNNESE